MSATNSSEPSKKIGGSMFEKLKQNITTIKDDIERRRQITNNQVHFTPRLANDPEETTVVIEKKRQQSPPPPPSPTEKQSQKINSIDDNLTNLNRSQSSQDIFSCDTTEQVKEMIMNNLRHEMERCRKRATSDSSINNDKLLNTTILRTGPRFRAHTIPSNFDLKRNLIYPVSIAIGLLSIIIILWKPISPFLSGYFLGFVCAGAIAYVIIRIYLLNKINSINIHEWIDFPDLETIQSEQDNTCCEIVFARYDADHDEEFIRYPAVIRLDKQCLIIQLPIKGKTEKEMKFIGSREYLLNNARISLVPEHTLTRVKYWLNEYPIVLQNIEISDKKIFNKDYTGKIKYDVEEFFNNSQTIISLFFETGPDKEDWFHRLALAIRKQDNKQLTNLNKSMSDSYLSINDNRLQKKTSIDIDRNEIDIAQVNETIIEQDSTARSSLKKKSKKFDENLDRLLKSTDCLDEAAITLNFLLRRLFCDVFEERLFKNLLKEKIELKLKEIAVSVLEDLHVESIDMGNTFPVILKVESMQWNTKGIWFKLFLFYRGSFKITIKTRIFLQKLLNSNSLIEQSMCYHNHSEQITHKEDERIEQEKSTTKEPELLENVAARKIGSLLTKVAANKHFQRFAALKPVAGVFEKLSNAEIGANIELLNISGMMTINIPPPPSDRIWMGFSEMPDLNLKVTPVFGESQYSYALIHDFLEARIQDEIKRLLVLPSMDDLLLPFFRDRVLEAFGELAI